MSVNSPPGHLSPAPAVSTRDDRRSHDKSREHIAFPDTNNISNNNGPLSPPLSPPTLRNKRSDAIISRRVKGKVNLRIHEAALFNHDYDVLSGGSSPRSPLYTSPLWTSNTFGGDSHHHDTEPLTDIQTSLDRFEEAMLVSSLPILDVYATTTFSAALNDPAVVSQLRLFAAATEHHRRALDDLDCLLQMTLFTETIHNASSQLTALITKHIATNSLTTSHQQQQHQPLRFLPPPTTKALHNDLRDTTTALLPRLTVLFADAHTALAHRLATDLYPPFLRHQLTRRLHRIGPGYSPNQTTPGFGDAFCLRDLAAGGAMVFASEGLAALTGFRIAEMLLPPADESLFHGAGTRRRRRGASGSGSSSSCCDLVLHYTCDGQRMYWSAIFTARVDLAAGGGTTTTPYLLAGHVDVTGLLERQEDVNDLLGYAAPVAAATTPSPKYPPSASRKKQLLHTLRRRRSSQASDETSPPPTPGSASTSSDDGSSVSSPYTRFMLLEYCPVIAAKVQQLPVAFCSGAAAAALTCGGSDSVVGRSVFEVLGTEAMAKSFKASVRASVAEGRTAKLDLALKGGASSLRGSRSLDRLTAVPMGAVASVASAGGPENFVSYWTPMKDDAGVVRWVVLILIPEVI